ncbi:sulfurtransferase [Brevibacterium litoralis]|uniref:sulfurtransferase n=1 Tax=Brevibacterium litoralis TaxID=3138935 RepID=UPI0032EF9B2B
MTETTRSTPEPSAAPRAREEVLVTAGDLATLRDMGMCPVLLDVRWSLAVPGSAPQTRADYEAGHIPGSLYVDLGRDLADHTETDPRAGRHPLPTPAQFQETVRGWGLETDTPVVVYDDNASQGAARCWWLLKWAGFTHVRVLDGGLSAWTGAGGDLSTEESEPVPSQVPITPGSMPTLDADAVAALAQDAAATVLDARAPERYRGDTEPLDPQAGHIPGARNAPVTDNVDGQMFRSGEELAGIYGSHGALEGPVGVYCGSGVTASLDVLSLHLLGVDAALYPGSWSAWSNDPARPVATGEE